MGVNYVLTFVLISISYVNAQEYVLLDQSDSNIWDTDDQNFIIEPDRIISSLCENYHVAINNNRIDCASIQLIPKEALEQGEHEIRRREAPEIVLEGSGKGESEQIIAPPEISLRNETSNKPESDVVASTSKTNTVAEVKEEDKGNAEIQISNLVETNPVLIAEGTHQSNETLSEREQTSKGDEKVQGVESKTDLPSLPTHIPISLVNNLNDKEDSPLNREESVKQEPEAVEPIKEVFETVANATTQPEKSEVVNAETVTSPPPVHITSETTAQKLETTVAPTQNSPKSTDTPVTNTEKPNVLAKEGGTDNSSNSDNKDSGKEGSTKVTPKVLPSDLAEVESINDKKESESTDDQQSGNAVLFKSPKSDGGAQVEGSESDKALQGMQENAKISNEPTDQPNTGESAKNVSRAGKDTTILVVLFVVVIAIGGAAFTHNYIKKRKQNASSNNELVNGIRRSLQNLSSNNAKNSTDVEQGTELKPLMKSNGPSITKDYTDTKKEVQA